MTVPLSNGRGDEIKAKLEAKAPFSSTTRCVIGIASAYFDQPGLKWTNFGMGWTLPDPYSPYVHKTLPGFFPGDLSHATQDRVPPKSRHDAWQLVPQALLPPPTDPQQINILKERGYMFDLFSPTHVPLDQPQPKNWGRSFSWDFNQPEIPFFKNEAIVVGTFKSHQVYLSPPHLSIYTDARISVEQALEPGPSNVSPGQTIDLLMPGGSVLLGDGRVIPSDSPYELSPYLIQPNHRYVFFLRYYSEGDNFIDKKDWELVNGVAVANHRVEVDRARRGQSDYSGLPESSFLEKLRKAIQDQQQH
jgi:hypothetical protein